MFMYDRLEELIAESGKTRAYLCRKMGRKEYYLRDVIRQKNVIPADLVEVLAAELKTSVEYLNGESDEKHPSASSAKEQSMIDLFRQMTPEEKAMAEIMLKSLLDSRK